LTHAKLDVAILSRTFGYLFGGGEMYDLNTARYLRSRGHRVTLFGAKPLFRRLSNDYLADCRVLPVIPDLRSIAYRLSRGGGRLRYLDHAIFCQRIAPLVRNAAPDVVQVCSIPIAARLLQRRNGVRRPVMVLVQHGPPNMYFREEYGRYDAVVAVGDAYEPHRALVPEGRLFRVDPGIDCERFSPGDKAQAKTALGVSGREVLLFVGRLVPGKGVLRLFDVVEMLAASRPEILCLIAGDGPAEDMARREIARRRLSPHVRMLGRVPNEALPEIYHASDVFVTCSEYESISITIMEAMSCGLQVVATRTGGIPLLVRNEENGWLISEGPGYERQFAERVASVLAGGAASAISHSNRERAVKEFGVQAQGDALLAIYNQCLENAR
jgi:glycosyltransferase involved in cell wall biosynthesis